MKLLKGEEFIILGKEKTNYSMYKSKCISNRVAISLLANALNNLI